VVTEDAQYRLVPTPIPLQGVNEFTHKPVCSFMRRDRFGRVRAEEVRDAISVIELAKSDVDTLLNHFEKLPECRGVLSVTANQRGPARYDTLGRPMLMSTRCANHAYDVSVADCHARY